MNMIFSLQNTSKDKYIQPHPPLNKTYLQPNPSSLPPSPSPSSLPTTLPPPIKKMQWGEPTWIFLHTMSQKVKEEHFNIIRIELLQMIYNTCSILPCPDCANHAISYLNQINFNALQTKKQLIDLIYTFHNEVNQRKQFEIFPYENLDKYSKAITVNVINNFLYVIQNKSSNNKMIANELYRKRIIISIKEWLYKNINHFDF
jgi:hypothetical protein